MAGMKYLQESQKGKVYSTNTPASAGSVQIQPQYKLDRTDAISIGKGLLISVAGAALTYLTAVIAKTDFSYAYGGTIINFTPIIFVMWTGIVNAARKYLDGV